ncbi:hypothetical protein BIV60_24045 [Bacillus sp. MUM 116]|uniref:hypothetical protein n=1 Tax=Bacillus sp. MUM 116 TaxID=1678002 RepID=UPI0008F57F85|nr:hypothetical protein [Bacillus sp. MUM 116]OIK09358.1 hypothetical protein BIV60_24045 [Bacillus sp. MUM 116]
MNYKFLFKKGIKITYFILILCLSAYSFLKPYYTYDLIPYTAATISIEQSSKEKIHDETFKTVESVLPKAVYDGFISGELGQEMLKDSESFYQQLNYYKVKPLYISLIYVIHKLGFGIVTAINIISVLSFLGISILLFLFISKLNRGYLGIIILSLLMVCQPFILIAGRNTPDTLSAFIILLSLFLVLNKKLKILPGVLLALSIAIRPDNLIISGALFLYFGLLAPKEYRLKFYQTLSFLILSAIIYFSISILEHSYGWKTQFTISFLHFIARPAEVTVQLSMGDYFRVLISNGIAVLNTHIIYFIAMGLVGLMVTNIKNINAVYSHLIVFTIGVMIVYFLLFPSQEVDRYFTTEYLLLLILSLRILCDNDFLKVQQWGQLKKQVS